MQAEGLLSNDGAELVPFIQRLKQRAAALHVSVLQTVEDGRVQRRTGSLEHDAVLMILVEKDSVTFP